MPQEKPAALSKSGMVLLLAGLLTVAAGGASPPPKKDKADKAAEKTKDPVKEPKPALIPFGDAIVVNLVDPRKTRYLRVKLILVVPDTEEKTITELFNKKKPFLKNWLISYLSNLSLEDVSGAAGINKIRREIQKQFNAKMIPDGSEKIDDVLFEEFVVQ